MKKPLTIVFIALTALASIPGVAQRKKIAPAPDPLSSFQLIVKKFTVFFSVPGKAVDKEDGHYLVWEFFGRDITYDVEKTSSLVSPYSAVIQMNSTREENGLCGDVTGVDKNDVIGWSTIEGALSAVDRSECYRYGYFPPFDKPIVRAMKFVFAFQEGKWVFKEAVDTSYPPGDSFLFRTLFLDEPNLGRNFDFSEPKALALNSAWRHLVQD